VVVVVEMVCSALACSCSAGVIIARRGLGRVWRSQIIGLAQGKKYHYFPSHKKLLRKHGNLSAMTTMVVHTSLQAAGFTGDNLEDISDAALRQAVKIVFVEWFSSQTRCVIRCGAMSNGRLQKFSYSSEVHHRCLTVGCGLLQYLWSEILLRGIVRRSRVCLAADPVALPIGRRSEAPRQA
jgi:hypothetical protein